MIDKPVAIVVGVGAELGLGAALCRRFAEGGHHVLVAGRSADKIEQVVRTIASKGGSAEAVPTDATREQDVIRLFDLAMTPRAGLDALDLDLQPEPLHRQFAQPIQGLGRREGDAVVRPNRVWQSKLVECALEQRDANFSCVVDSASQVSKQRLAKSVIVSG